MTKKKTMKTKKTVTKRFVVVSFEKWPDDLTNMRWLTTSKGMALDAKTPEEALAYFRDEADSCPNVAMDTILVAVPIDRVFRYKSSFTKTKIKSKSICLP